VASDLEGLHGAGRSHIFVAPPPQWKLKRAPGAAPCLELLQNGPFCWAPAGASFGAAGALQKGPNNMWG